MGFSDSAEGTQAFRWTAEDGMVGIGDLGGLPYSGQAFDVSDDGSVLWTEAFGSSGTDRGVMLQETADGAFIFTGGIWSERDEAPDLFLAKIPAGGTAALEQENER